MFASYLLQLLLLGTSPQVHAEVTVIAKDGAVEQTQTINQETVEAYTLLSHQDTFSQFPSLSLNTRGPYGVQADISYRGARGNQVGVLLNGIPMNNIQTHHHNFNLPVAPEDLASFSVRSASSGVNNPYAFSGQVELNTLDNRGERYNLAYGTDNYYHIFAADRGLSYMLEGSSGYRDNTDFHTTNLTWQGMLRGGVKIFTAFNQKHFGAQDFYSPYNSYEKTQTALAAASWKGITLYSVKHDDTFFLIRDNPDYYRNDHTTYRSGIFRDFQWGQLSFSAHAAANRMESNSLMEPDMNPEDLPYTHNDQEGTLKAAYLFNLGNWSLRPGLTLSMSSRGDTEWLPFMGVYGNLGSVGLALEASRSVRLPDYTELYYRSPVNEGNPELEAETAWNADLSANWRTLSATLFYREESDLIDWVRRDETWHAENIGSDTVWGLELNATYKRLSVGYQMVSRDRDLTLETKYYYYTPRNRWVVRYHGREGSLTYQYLDIPELGNASILDLTFFGSGFYLKVQNALDDNYQTLPGIPMPGRTYVLGYRINGPLNLW